MFRLVIVVVMLSAVSAHADELGDCKQRTDRDRQMTACTTLIKDKKLDVKKKAVASTERGLAYRVKGDIDKAIADFNQAIQLDANSDTTYFMRGSAYHAQGKLDLAIADYTRLIKLKPANLGAYDNRGSAYYTKGEIDRAIADVDQAIRLAPSYARAYNSRGKIYRDKGEFDRAIADFDIAIRLSPDYAGSYINRGLTVELKGDRERAIADYRKALSLRPGDRLATHRLKALGVSLVEQSAMPAPSTEPRVALPAPAATADDATKTDDQRECANARDPERQIAACARVIERGNLGKDRLVPGITSR